MPKTRRRVPGAGLAEAQGTNNERIAGGLKSDSEARFQNLCLFVPHTLAYNRSVLSSSLEVARHVLSGSTNERTGDRSWQYWRAYLAVQQRPPLVEAQAQ